MKKKIIIIILIIILILVAIYGLLKIFSKGEENIDITSTFFPEILSNFIKNENSTNQENNFDTSSNVTTSQQKSSFYKIEDHNVSDISLLETIPSEAQNASTTSETDLRTGQPYLVTADKKTGNLFLYNLTNRNLTRLSNTTIQNITDIFLSNTNESAFVYIKSLENNNKKLYSYLVDLENYKENSSAFKMSSLNTILASQRDKIFTEQEASDIYRSDFDLSNPRLILKDQKLNWDLHPANNSIFINQKPSSLKETSVYVIQNSSQLKKIIANKKALQINPSSDGNYIIYSSLEDSLVKLYLYNNSTQSSTLIPLNTVPEKCTWALNQNTFYCVETSTLIREGDYPERWYKGSISFQDTRIVGIEADNVSQFNLTAPFVDQKNIDAAKVKISENSEYFIIKNKIDDTVWIMELTP